MYQTKWVGFLKDIPKKLKLGQTNKFCAKLSQVCHEWKVISAQDFRAIMQIRFENQIANFRHSKSQSEK